MTRNNKLTAIGLFIIFVLSNCVPAIGLQIKKSESNEVANLNSAPGVKYIDIELSFSDPEVVEYGNYWVVRIKETNYNKYVLFDLNPGKPVIPFNISFFNLVFGSKIIEVNYKNSTPEIINISGKIAFCKASYDTLLGDSKEIPMDKNIYESSEPYPSDWVTYHTGGGLSQGEHTTFLVVRIYPVRYFPMDNHLQFIRTIKVNISYNEPFNPIIGDNNLYDLLIIAPAKFIRQLKPLVCHKNRFGVRTKLISLNYIYKHIWNGRDRAEKIKLFIKEGIEESGIKYVLLVGGIKRQSFLWNLPARYSHVLPTEEGESTEKSFISDLYYADIYDGEGKFSSWDSNHDNIFSLWNDTIKDEMDLYPDVYLGRLPCRSILEVKVMVNKIIGYEKDKCSDKDWFKNLILVAGDSYNDTNDFNEGELISEEAIDLMPGFTPVRVYAREGRDINRKTVNEAMNNGAGFAYFCGHGSVSSWSTHFPPDGTKWTTGYKCGDMISLRNRGKLPVTVIGGCHNGEFDATMWNIINGFLKDGFRYFRFRPKVGGFWYVGWIPNCWAWWLTSKVGGGAIATISNTGLGTHGSEDLDNNSIADYLEILDGWLELRFLELYGTKKMDILGKNHGDTISDYLNRFLGDYTKLDVKMVQQWVLFGDPTLKIGGYE